MTITQEEISALRAKLAKATPGEWRLFNRNRTLCVHTGQPSKDMREIIHWMGFDSSHYQKKNIANADLIVAAKNALPDLLDLASAAIAAREGAIREAATLLNEKSRTYKVQAANEIWDHKYQLLGWAKLLEENAAAILSLIPTPEPK